LQFVNENKTLYAIWISLSYFFFGGHFSIFPTVTVRIFGNQTGPKVYALIYTGFAFATIIGVVLSKVIIPAWKELGADAYTPIFYALAALTAIAIIILVFFKDTPIERKVTEKSSYRLAEEKD
jgi:predicted MFS family arabinose efflux permease